MSKEDVTQVAEIDHEAFPGLWPAVNYNRELENRLAYYIVACDGGNAVGPSIGNSLGKESARLVSRLKRLFGYDCSSDGVLPRLGKQWIIGFAGFWIMAGEAHITSIAVRNVCRRQGVGEVLLISVIDLAAELKARVVTLEVRVSNTVAQSLYYKYGFTQTGLRRNYYDDREDAIIMTTENITSSSFQVNLKRLKQAHSRKWERVLYYIPR
jgi:ribosomal-protein-alanine N-acetyltransferase